MHARHPDRCDCCAYCRHPASRHRRAGRGACKVRGCECVVWRAQLTLWDPELDIRQRLDR